MYMVPKLDEDNNVLSAPVLLIASFVVSFGYELCIYIIYDRPCNLKILNYKL